MTPLRLSILFYLGVLFMAYTDRPNRVFKENGDLQEFGLGKGKTLFSPAVIGIIISFIVYFVFLNITFILNIKNKL